VLHNSGPAATFANWVIIGRTYRCPGRDSPVFPVFNRNDHRWIQLVWHLAEIGRKACLAATCHVSNTVTSSAASLCPAMTTTLAA
jgi:hypothetical protein